LIPFVDVKPLSGFDFAMALLFGVAFTLGLIAYYKAAQLEEISKVVMLFNLEPIMILVLSMIFLGDILTKNHLIGFFMLLGAAILVSYNKTEEKFKLSKAFYLMILSGLLASIGFVAIKHVYNSAGFWNASIWLRLANMVSMLVLFMPSVRKEFVDIFIKNRKKARNLLIFKMIIDFFAFVILGLAIVSGPIALVNVLMASLLPLTVFLLTVISSRYYPHIIKEELKKEAVMRKLIAIVLIISGLIFINMHV
jgi:drug/metabolite transporter (DMT)-like permease